MSDSHALTEYIHVRQPPGEGRRRWFEGRVIDLVVWYADGPTVDGFQLLYRSKEGERALTWRRGVGFAASRVDNGTMSPCSNVTPILLPHNGDVPWEKLVTEFERNSGNIETELRELIVARLQARG